jgi:GNAT superfamily N-acetyltransferase
MIEIRPATLDDVIAVTALRTAVHPFQVRTVAGTTSWWANTWPEERLLVVVATDSGDVVGWAFASFQTWTTQGSVAEATVIVHPDHRGRGIGHALWEPIEAHLEPVDTIQGFSDGDPASRAFATRRGFETTLELRYTRLDLARLPDMPSVPDGVTLVSGTEIGPEDLYRIDTVAIADEPHHVPMDAIPYDEWRADNWDSPDHDWDLAVVALADGVPAAHTKVIADPSTSRVWSDGTGTLPRHRGRGLAKLVKSVSMRRAVDAGYEAAYTCNAGVNAPMLAVNDWLGYRPAATLYGQIRRSH